MRTFERVTLLVVATTMLIIYTAAFITSLSDSMSTGEDQILLLAQVVVLLSVFFWIAIDAIKEIAVSCDYNDELESMEYFEYEPSGCNTAGGLVAITQHL